MGDEKARAILKCSKESFRMYNTLCAGSKDELKQKGKKKRKEKIFYSRTPAFYLAAAVGILNNQSMTKGNDEELTRRSYIVENMNFGPFSQLIKTKFDIKNEAEIVEKLLEYQEFGIRELYDEYHKTGKIDFLGFYRTAKSNI